MSDPSSTAGAVKPKLRGVLHQWAAVVAAIAGLWLTFFVAPTARASWAAAVYALSLVVLFTTSAFYHRIDWSPVARARMRRADHASIFVQIAGTYTPVALLGVSPELGRNFLLITWGGALLGIAQSLFWLQAPKALTAILAVAVGWSVIPYWTPATAFLTSTELWLFVAGGVFYTLGAIAYALKRPKLVPEVFGYHEVFHACTLVASAIHFLAVYSIVVRS